MLLSSLLYYHLYTRRFLVFKNPVSSYHLSVEKMHGVIERLVLVIIIDDPRFTGWTLHPFWTDKNCGDCGVVYVCENGRSGVLMLHRRYSELLCTTPKLL